MTYALIGLLGFCLGWLACDYLWRKRTSVLSNWSKGDIITTGDGERLYVCAVERDLHTKGVAKP